MNLKIFRGYKLFWEHYPAEAVEYALKHKEEAIPELLEILDFTLNDVEHLSQDPHYIVHMPVIYLLACFRETKAYEYIIKIASLPGELIFDLMGDAVTEDFRNILASVCDGNIEPIQAIIENPDLDEYVRAEAVQSLLVLLSNDVITREQLVFYFKHLFTGALDSDNSFVWEALIHCCSLIHPGEFVEDIKKVTADNKSLEFIADLGFLNRQLKRSVESVLDDLKANDDYSYINEDDVRTVEYWFDVSSEEDDDEYDDEDEYDLNDEYNDDEYDGNDDDGLEPPLLKSIFDEDDRPKNVPLVREVTVGRNDPCPCGSGKKYKKCCLDKE